MSRRKIKNKKSSKKKQLRHQEAVRQYLLEQKQRQIKQGLAVQENQQRTDGERCAEAGDQQQEAEPRPEAVNTEKMEQVPREQ